MTAIRNEPESSYLVQNTYPGDDAIADAIKILEARLHKEGAFVTSPDSAKDLAFLSVAGLEHEVFAVIWMTNKHQQIGSFDAIFRGTVDGASIPPREVVKEALARNAVACVFVHNHPSGDSTPSKADFNITKTLQQALALVSVRVLDHLVIGDTRSAIYSFAEHGEI